MQERIGREAAGGRRDAIRNRRLLGGHGSEAGDGSAKDISTGAQYAGGRRGERRRGSTKGCFGGADWTRQGGDVLTWDCKVWMHTVVVMMRLDAIGTKNGARAGAERGGLGGSLGVEGGGTDRAAPGIGEQRARQEWGMQREEAVGAQRGRGAMRP